MEEDSISGGAWYSRSLEVTSGEVGLIPLIKKEGGGEKPELLRLYRINKTTINNSIKCQLQKDTNNQCAYILYMDLSRCGFSMAFLPCNNIL